MKMKAKKVKKKLHDHIQFNEENIKNNEEVK